MKKIIALASIAALVAAPALAGSNTVEFTRDDGTTQVWKFNDDGTAEGPEGTAATYTWDDEAKKLCATAGGETPETRCITFSEMSSEGEAAVGDTAKYSTDDGKSGVAKIIAVEKSEEKAAE
ncbi:MAG: hypothetical protein AB7F91_09375 [Parvularculaceae bacterium]|nr:hypothetical protein [Parvularculaceae bacterium]